jgi:hypothetical protein
MKTFRPGWVTDVFEYVQAQEVCEAFQRHEVRFMFIGKSGAFLLGFPDTTQDADVFVEKSSENGQRVLDAVLELGFEVPANRREEIRRGKDFVQLKHGPFDLDLIFAPDGIERFEDAWARHIDVGSLPVCHIDDIIASKRATGRPKDRESLPRLLDFREYWLEQRNKS